MEENNNQMQQPPAGSQGGNAPMGNMNNMAGQEMPHEMSPEPAKKSGNFGPITGIIIIIALLALGGLYFWGSQLNEQAEKDAMMMFDESANDDIANQNDEPEAIEQDLNTFNSTEFDAQLEADLEAIDSEL